LVRTAGRRTFLRIGVIGDSGFGEEITNALVARMAQQNLDSVLHTGDLMYRGDEEW
jgi:predicted phosphodiesterase